VIKAVAKLVREAEVLRKTAGKLPGAKDGVPSLERALKNDLFFSSTPVAEDGAIVIQPVLKSKAYEDQLRRAAVPALAALHGQGLLRRCGRRGHRQADGQLWRGPRRRDRRPNRNA
jgi:hypothetical protein